MRDHGDGLSVPKLALRRSATASSKRSRSCLASSAPGSGRAVVGGGWTRRPLESAALARRAFTLFHVHRVRGARKITAIWIQRTNSDSKGRTLLIEIVGKTHQIT